MLLDHYTPQTWTAIMLLSKFFGENMDVKRVVDLGTGCGGLTLFFGAHMLQRDGKVLSFDIEETQSAQARRDFAKLNIDFRKMSVFSKDALRITREFITDERALIFCDNGNKSLELPLYAMLLKSGDFIMAHDWGIEISEGDLEATSEILEPYKQDEFDAAETYILSMRRI